MTRDSILIKKVAIVTNNIDCEGHVQYYSMIEKYFKYNHWEIRTNFEVDKVVICACGYHDCMFKNVKRVLERLKKRCFPEQNIVIMGCLSKTHELELKKGSTVQIIELHREELLDNIIQAKIPFYTITPNNMLKFHKEYGTSLKNNYFYIKIAEGCLGKCTFCVIKKARGHIRSVPLDEIVKQYEIAIQRGYRKIFLIGDDSFAYGVDIGSNIMELLQLLLAIEPKVEFYFGNFHAQWIVKYSSDILSLCKKGVIKRLYMGLQHVNDELLKKMGRSVQFASFYEVICRIKRECPGLLLQADIIVGFPGETKELFEEVIEFFKKDKCFSTVVHFGFSDVKGADSFKFKGKLDPTEIAIRWVALSKVLGKRSLYNESNASGFFQPVPFKEYHFFCEDSFEEMKTFKIE